MKRFLTLFFIYLFSIPALAATINISDFTTTNTNNKLCGLLDGASDGTCLIAGNGLSIAADTLTSVVYIDEPVISGNITNVPFIGDGGLGNPVIKQDSLFQFNTFHNPGLNVGSKIWVNDGVAETPDSSASIQLSANTIPVDQSTVLPILHFSDGAGGYADITVDERAGLPSGNVYLPHQSGTLALVSDILPLTIGEPVSGATHSKGLYVNTDDELDQYPLEYFNPGTFGTFRMTGSLDIRATPGTNIGFNATSDDGIRSLFVGFDVVGTGLNVGANDDTELVGYDQGAGTYYWGNRNMSLDPITGVFSLQTLSASIGDNNFIGNGTIFGVDDAAMSVFFSGVYCDFNAIYTRLGGFLEVAQDITFNNVGHTLFIKTGTNAKVGTATLAGGTVTIPTTAITANSIIELSTPRGTVLNLGMYYESARIVGTSFTITSANVLDASTFDWWLVEKY